MRPELAWSGATPPWRASCASLWKRPIGPISASSFAAVIAPQPGSSSSAGAICALSCSSSRSSRMIMRDSERQRTTRSRRRGPAPRQDDERASGRRVRARLPVEPLREHDEGRVKLVQMPAQPLLDPAALVDEILAVIDQQLQLSVGLLVRTRPVSSGSRSADPRDGERVDRVRLATLPPGAPPSPVSFGGTRTSCSPAAISIRSSAPVTCRQSSIAHSRSPPSPRPHQQDARRVTAAVRSSSIRPASSTATAVNDCLCTSTPITIIASPPTTMGATGERTGLNRGSSQAPIRSRSTVSGRRRRHNAGKSAPTDIRNGVSRRRPESLARTGRHHHTSLTLSSGMTPERPAILASVQGDYGGGRVESEQGGLVLRTGRLSLLPLTGLDEAEHARASRNAEDALRDTRAAEAQWREYGFGPWAIRDNVRKVSRRRRAALCRGGDRGDRRGRSRGGLVGHQGAADQGIATEAMDAAIGDLWGRTDVQKITAYMRRGRTRHLAAGGQARIRRP